jgi:D-alanyl-D-alanine carboxypeptidase/D-alanyl-D-alanine-endopeptidase (penicillin-binding protein 4)
VGVLTALALAGCGGSGHGASQADLGPGLAARHAPKVRPSPALRHLQRSLRRALAKAGRASGAAVYDLHAGGLLFQARANVRRPPASVEKLYTSVALLRKFGPNARFRTSVLGVGHLGPGGVWRGDLYLRGGGDPTFGDGKFNRIWEQGYGPTAGQLSQQLRNRGIRSVTGTLIGDASLFDGRPGGPSSAFAPDIPDFGGQLSALTYDHGATAASLSPGAFAAAQLARTLRSQGVAVRAASLTSLTPRRTHRLASVKSPPMSILLKLMDVPSDDLFAEMLTKQLGVRFGGGGMTARGARVISRMLRSYRIHPKILDGSGLSRDDRSSPAEVVSLLRQVWRTDIGRVLSTALPVVGVSGTVTRIAVHTAAQGRCVAKTGTLNGVTNLAGYCAARHHHEVAFALFIDGPDNAHALVLLGRMVAAIAQY